MVLNTSKCNHMIPLHLKGLTHYRSFVEWSSQPITWLVQKPGLNQIKLEPSYNTKTSTTVIHKTYTYADKSKSNKREPPL